MWTASALRLRPLRAASTMRTARPSRLASNRLLRNCIGGGRSRRVVSLLFISPPFCSRRRLSWSTPRVAIARVHPRCAQRTPLHYVAHGSDRLHALVYLFSPQNFQTWLSRRSTSHLNFAPPLPLANLTAELEDAQLATIDILLANNADADARDATQHDAIGARRRRGRRRACCRGCSMRWPTG